MDKLEEAKAIMEKIGCEKVYAVAKTVYHLKFVQ